MTVMAIGNWNNNAEMIESCADLGYLRDEVRTLDPTYGLGRFWSNWKPGELVGCDIDPERSPIGYSVDFREMPFDDGEFGQVVLDGPYGLRGTPTMASDAAYGLVDNMAWQDRMRLCIDGITECVRVLSPGGTLLVKCQDQVCSGQVRWQTREFADHAEALGCRLVDMLHLVSYRPQPEGRRQVHARRNYSTMLVLRRERA